MIDVIQAIGALLAVAVLIVMMDREQGAMIRLSLALVAVCLLMLGANDLAATLDLPRFGHEAREVVRAVLYWAIGGAALGRLLTMRTRSEPRAWIARQERTQ